MRTLLGTFAAVAALTLTACGADESDDDNDSGSESSDTTSAAADPTASSSAPTDGAATDAGTVSVEDLEAKIVVGEPPVDLTWSVPGEIPADWKALETGQGELQWQVGDSRCIVYLNQPAGLGTDPTPTSDDVAKDFVTHSLESTGATPELGEVTQELLPNHVNAGAVEVQSQFSVVDFTAPDQQIEGTAYGYRAGDFALASLGLCGSGQWAEHGPAIEAFLASLAAQTTY